jgi:hypothetical protein
MNIYLALGDSISIDDYTGVRGGGAASQLARKLDVELVDLTFDGNTTDGVLADLARPPATVTPSLRRGRRTEIVPSRIATLFARCVTRQRCRLWWLSTG